MVFILRENVKQARVQSCACTRTLLKLTKRTQQSSHTFRVPLRSAVPIPLGIALGVIATRPEAAAPVRTVPVSAPPPVAKAVPFPIPAIVPKTASILKRRAFTVVTVSLAPSTRFVVLLVSCSHDRRLFLYFVINNRNDIVLTFYSV